MKMVVMLNCGLVMSLFSGCMKIVMAVSGVHQPEKETKESIVEFCEKKGIDTAGMLMISESWFFPMFYEELNLSLLFDHNGYSVNFNKTSINPECSGNIFAVLNDLKNADNFPRDSSRTIAKERERWVYLPSKGKFEEPLPGNYEFVIVYYWNKFSGNPNHRNHIRELKKAVFLNPDVSIRLILVNQDMRSDVDYESWYNEYLNSKPTVTPQ